MKIPEDDRTVEAVKNAFLGQENGRDGAIAAIRAINSLPCPATTKTDADVGERHAEALNMLAKAVELLRLWRYFGDTKFADAEQRTVLFIADYAGMRDYLALPSPSGGRQGGKEPNDSSPLLVPTQPQGPEATGVVCGHEYPGGAFCALPSGHPATPPAAPGTTGCAHCSKELPPLPTSWRSMLFCDYSCVEAYAHAHGIGYERTGTTGEATCAELGCCAEYEERSPTPTDATTPKENP